MTEENKTKTVQTPTPEQVVGQSAQAPAQQAGAKAELTVQDLNVIKTIIDVASQRGAFKANEMAMVGTVYNKLEGFLTIVEKSQKEANKASAPTGESTTEKK